MAWAPFGFTTRQICSLSARPIRCSRWFSSRTELCARSTSITPTPLLAMPGIDRRRTRFPDLGRGSPWQRRNRAILGGHGDPVFGFSEDRRLAGDRVAQDRKAVPCADGKGVEAVEIGKCRFERLGQAHPLAQAPSQIARGNLGVVVGLEPDALAP